MPTLKFNQCEYDCYGKQTKKGFRAYCHRMDKKCDPSYDPRIIPIVKPKVPSMEKTFKEMAEEQARLTKIIEDTRPDALKGYRTTYRKVVIDGDLFYEGGGLRHPVRPADIATLLSEDQKKALLSTSISKELPYAKLKMIPHLPEYMGTAKPEIIITKSEVEKAIMRARQHAPGEWQAEILEIALIPKMQQFLVKQNPYYTLERVPNGYVLHHWNPPERPYVSTAYDGFRRNFYDLPLHGLRGLVLSEPETVNIPAVDEWLRQDKMGFRNN